MNENPRGTRGRTHPPEASLTGTAIQRSLERLEDSRLNDLQAITEDRAETAPASACRMRLVLDDSGQDMIEYALVAGLLGLAALSAVRGLGNMIATAFSSIGSSVASDTV